MQGRFFETLVRLIQESLKDNPSAQIFQNHKLISKNGEPGEFDVVIQTTANSYPICIVLECKDYGRKVSVKEVDAFNSKCQRFSGISKKVIVSKEGFQRGAITAAKGFDISLFQLNDLKDSIVQDWVKQFYVKEITIDASIVNVRLQFITMPLQKINMATEIQSDCFPEKVKLSTLAKDLFSRKFPVIKDEVMPKYSRLSNDLAKDGNNITAIKIDGTFPEINDWKLFVSDANNRNYIQSIGATYFFKFGYKQMAPTTAKSYIEIDNPLKSTEVLTFNSELTNSMLTVIRDSDNEKHLNIMITDKDGKPLKPDEIPLLLPPNESKTIF